jgi:hypothetical protein
MNLKTLYPRTAYHAHWHPPPALSRRRFLSAAAGAAGLLLGAGTWSPARAGGNSDPNPIPGGLDFLGDGTIFHVLAPGYPGTGLDPAANDPSTIADFNGAVGLAYVRGTGTHTDKTTDPPTVSRIPWEIDLRFMKGEYVGVDGKRHQGAFALV